MYTTDGVQIGTVGQASKERGCGHLGSEELQGAETGFDLSSSSASVHWRFHDFCLQPHSSLPQPWQVVVSPHPMSWVRKLRHRKGKRLV